MDDAALANLEHENLIAAFSGAGSQIPGAIIQRGDGVAVFLTGHPLRLFNQILIDTGGGPADRTAEAIGAAVAVARDRGDPFIVSLRRGVDDDLRPHMMDLGLESAGDTPWIPGFALHPLPSVGTSSAVDGLDIRAATDGAGIRDHVVAAADGFEMPREWLEAIMTDRMLKLPDVTVYVGHSDGAPVVSGMGVRTGRTIGVYNIATVPAARRRGFGAAMTQRIVDDGAAAGCDVAVLQATEMGRPIYERLGYRLVVEYDGYVDPE